jgi:hypothetical protein
MPRTITLFAVSSLVLLVLGLTLTRYGTNVAMSLTLPGSQVTRGISLQTPCYGLASLFGFFACLYAIGYIPFSSTLAPWHFWLSSAGVVLYAVGFVALGRGGMAAARAGAESSQGVLWLAFLGLAGGPLSFLLGQALFVFDLVRAVPRMVHS